MRYIHIKWVDGNFLTRTPIKINGYVLFQINHDIGKCVSAGVSEFNNASWSLKEALQDDVRRDYHHRHLQQVQLAVK